MIYLQLFIVFFKIGLVSFGGGMAMLPLIDREATKHGWITPEQFLDIVAVGGMAPGPVATNTAILIGYEAAGAPGSLAATLGMMLPSLLIILLVSLFFFRVKESQLVQSAFYALRPVITGLIIYAAITFALRNEMISAEKWADPVQLLIMVAALLLLLFTRIPSVLVIILSGVAGIILFPA